MSSKILESPSMINLQKHSCQEIFRPVYNSQRSAALLESIPRPPMYVPKKFPSQVQKTPMYPSFPGFPLEAAYKLSLMKPRSMAFEADAGMGTKEGDCYIPKSGG